MGIERSNILKLSDQDIAELVKEIEEINTALENTEIINPIQLEKAHNLVSLVTQIARSKNETGSPKTDIEQYLKLTEKALDLANLISSIQL